MRTCPVRTINGSRRYFPFDVREEYAKLYGQRTEERVAGFAQAFAERGRKAHHRIGRPTIDKSDHRNRRLLRPCGKRPRHSAPDRDSPDNPSGVRHPAYS